MTVGGGSTQKQGEQLKSTGLLSRPGSGVLLRGALHHRMQLGTQSKDSQSGGGWGGVRVKGLEKVLSCLGAYSPSCILLFLFPVLKCITHL